MPECVACRSLSTVTLSHCEANRKDWGRRHGHTGYHQGGRKQEPTPSLVSATIFCVLLSATPSARPLSVPFSKVG